MDHCNVENLDTCTSEPCPINIDADPLFVDRFGGDGVAGTEDDDLRLSENSPSIDEGDDALLPVDTLDVDDNGNFTEDLPIDLCFQNRVIAMQVDQGVYEFLTCPGDINGDGQVDGADLGIVLGDFGNSNTPSDLNCDGEVDGADLGIVLGGFDGGEDYPRSCTSGGQQSAQGGGSEGGSSDGLAEVFEMFGAEGMEEFRALLEENGMSDVVAIFEEYFGV